MKLTKTESPDLVEALLLMAQRVAELEDYHDLSHSKIEDLEERADQVLHFLSVRHPALDDRWGQGQGGGGGRRIWAGGIKDPLADACADA